MDNTKEKVSIGFKIDETNREEFDRLIGNLDKALKELSEFKLTYTYSVSTEQEKTE